MLINILRLPETQLGIPLLHTILLYAHWLLVAIYFGEYAWRVLLRRAGEFNPGNLQLTALLVTALLAWQLQEGSTLESLQASALRWRLFWHSIAFLGLASAQFWIMFARYRLKLELGKPL